MNTTIILIISTIILTIILIIVLIPQRQSSIEHLTTFNGYQSVDDQYYSDKIFENVVYYPNEYNKEYESAEEIGELVKRGIDKCYEECKGTCTEFGVHGIAHCFNPYE